MGIYNPNTGKLYSKLEQVGRGLLGETQHGTGSANFLNPKNWGGTTGKALDSVGDAYNGLRSGVQGVMGAAGAAGKLRALAPLAGAGLRAAAPVTTGLQLKDTVRDVATTSTDDYNKRLEAVPGFTPGNNIDKGSMFDRATNALGMREDAGGYMDKAWRGLVNTAGETLGAGKIVPDDIGLRQYGRDVLTRTAGALSDIGANAADVVWMGDTLRSNFADVQEKQAAADRLRAATKPKPPAAPTPAAPTPAAPEVDQKAAAAALDQKMVAESPNGYVEMPPQKGLQSNTYTNVPSQIDNFANAKGTVSTIEGPGVEGFMRQLNTIRSLREPETPVQDRIHVISNPGWATLSGGSGNSVIAKAMEAIDNLPRDMSSGNKAEAIAHLLGVANSAKQVDNMATRETARPHSDSGSPSFRDLLEVKKFQYQVGRDQLQDGLSVDANNRNNRLAGATLAATGQNIEKGREDIASKQFESMFRKQDDKGNDIADTGSVGRFRTELAQAIDTLANSGDKNDVARFGTQYKKADGSTGLRARHWDELTDSDKAALVRGFKFADHARKYADGGDRGGNFAEYMRGRKDAQGRVVFGSNGKTRAIFDAETLNSNGASSNPLVAVNPFDKRKFGIYEPRDFSEFYK